MSSTLKVTSIVATVGAAVWLWRVTSTATTKKRRLVRDPSTIGALATDSKGFASEDIPVYDVVIIGGGTAGSVLAARLSEDPSVKVLLLEAGGSAQEIPFCRIPLGFPKLFFSEHDHAIWTVPQTHANGQPAFWPRGKFLGGCSAMNAMMFHKCAPADYDEWSKAVGEPLWNWSNFQKAFRKFESFSPNPDFPGVKVEDHGSKGPIKTGYHSYFSDASRTWLQACEAIGISLNPDVNGSRGTLGATKIMTYIDETKSRSSAETGYLDANTLERPNLTVALHAQVNRILFNDSRAVGVEFASKKAEGLYRVRATKEVLLCAGAVHTPHILKLSGIGPAEELRAHSIPVVADLPGVGQNLVDHPVVYASFATHDMKDINYLAVNSARAVKDALEYTLRRTGPLSSNVAEVAAFLRSDDPKIFPSSDYKPLIDATSGSDAPDIELISGPSSFEGDGVTHVLGMGAVLLRPLSSGSVTLKSNDPRDPPVVDPNYLSNQNDADVLTRGFKTILRIARTNPYNGWWVKGERDDPLLDTKNDEELEQIVRERARTLYHPMCSAKMGPRESGGVLDAFLRVHSIPNLRVVDASAFPTPASGHTAAPTLALAEQAAEFIARDLRLV